MNQVDFGAGALWSLAPISILVGIAMVFVFRRWSNRHAIRGSTNRILAHLLEFRLFIDEPALVMRTNLALLQENWRLLKLLLRPTIILAAPFIVLLAEMDAFYSRAPLRIGDPGVVTVQLKRVNGAVMRDVVLSAPRTIAVETAGLQVGSQDQISWRIRAAAPSSGALHVIAAGRVVTKSISAGPGIHYLSERRVNSPLAFLLYPFERPFFDSPFAWIEVLYPSATILHWHWLLWFMLISTATAILSYALSGMINRIFV
jgi:hypothetical protein